MDGRTDRERTPKTVTRQAAAMSRKQEPQVLGDAGRVLVGK